MKGLLLKDFLVGRKQILIALVFSAIYAMIFSSGTNREMVVLIPMFFFASMNLTFMGYDAKVNFDAYLLSTSIRRKDLVLARYLMGILMMTSGALIAVAIKITLESFVLSEITPIFWQVAIFWSITMIYSSVLLPIVYRWGIESIRIVGIIILFIPVATIIILTKILNLPLNTWISNLMSGISPWLVLMVVLGIAIVSYGISYLVSKKIFNQKDL